jgi:succinate dehydrogenase / fumarate reductase, cytochrome b subunit
MKIPSLVKKYLMAATGVVLVGFVLGHMLGNAQMWFPTPHAINIYAHFLQSLPWEILYGIRAFLLLCVVVHIAMAVLLTIENKKARPEGYKAESTVQASYSSRVMPYTGFIILAFIIFHLLHYTIRADIHHDFGELYKYNLKTDEYVAPVAGEDAHHGGDDNVVYDVHGMMIAGFSVWWVSAFYIVSMFLLCSHLSHGISSMFQTLGLRNEAVRYGLSKVAYAAAIIVFLGFISIPVGVLAGAITTENPTVIEWRGESEQMVGAAPCCGSGAEKIAEEPTH